MNGINKAIILGRVGMDPKTQTFANGSMAANFTMATTERGFRTKSGQEVPERTEWHNICVFGNLAGIVANYVRKGSQLYVEGKIRTRNYDDKQGVKHYVTEIIADEIQLLGSKNEDGGGAAAPISAEQYPPRPVAQSPQSVYEQQYARDLAAEMNGNKDLPF